MEMGFNSVFRDATANPELLRHLSLYRIGQNPFFDSLGCWVNPFMIVKIIPA